jgi:hypothetical protein
MTAKKKALPSPASIAVEDPPAEELHSGVLEVDIKPKVHVPAPPVTVSIQSIPAGGKFKVDDRLYAKSPIQSMSNLIVGQEVTFVETWGTPKAFELGTQVTPA